jgi:hypothetical protein
LNGGSIDYGAFNLLGEEGKCIVRRISELLKEDSRFPKERSEYGKRSRYIEEKMIKLY